MKLIKTISIYNYKDLLVDIEEQDGYCFYKVFIYEPRTKKNAQIFHGVFSEYDEHITDRIKEHIDNNLFK